MSKKCPVSCVTIDVALRQVFQRISPRCGSSTDQVPFSYSMARHLVIPLCFWILTASVAMAEGEDVSFRNQMLEESDTSTTPVVETQDIGRLRALAEQGNAQAQYHMGMLCWSGQGGVERDIFQAMDWLRKAADQNHLEAEYNLGRIFLQGNAMEDAANSFTRAAYRGHSGAQNSLGRMYVMGTGVKRDLIQAYAWWLVASQSGSRRAEQNRAKLQEQFSRDQILQAESLARTFQSQIRPN